MEKIINYLKQNEFKYLFAILSFLIPTIVYNFTFVQGVYWFDSGEYVTTAWTWGIAHPAGYPTYNTIGFIFSHALSIFTDNIAWIMNFMAALACSLGTLFMFLSLNYILKKPFYGFIASIITAFVVNYWSQATFAEVYGLNVFFVSLMIYIILKWDEHQTNKYLYWFSFIFALGCGNHLTIISVSPAFILFIIYTKWDIVLKWKDGWKTIIIMSIIFGGTFLAIYSQFFISTYIDTPFRWVSVRSSHDFFWLATAKNYGATGCKVDFIKYWDYIIRGLSIVYSQFGEVGKLFMIKKGSVSMVRDVPIYLGTMVVALGIVSMLLNLFEKYTRYILLYLMISFGYILYYGSYEPFPDFIVPTYLCFGTFVAFGFKDICEMVKDSIRNSSKEMQKIIMIVIYVLISLLPLIYIIDNTSDNDKGAGKDKCAKYDFLSADDYARTMLDSVPKNSMILFGGDSETPIMYYQYVKKYRPDVFVTHIYLYALEKYGIVDAKIIEDDLKKKYSEYQTRPIENIWVSLAKKDLIDPNIGKRDIYVINFDPSTDYSFCGQWIKHGVIKDDQGNDKWKVEVKEWDNTDLLSDYNLIHYANISKVVPKEDDAGLYITKDPNPEFKLNVNVNNEFTLLGFDIDGSFNKEENMLFVPKGKYIPITFYYKANSEIQYFNTEKFSKLSNRNRDLCKKLWGLYKVKLYTADYTEDNEEKKKLKENPPLIIQEQRPLWYGIPTTIEKDTYLKEKLHFFIKSDRVKVGEKYSFHIGFLDATEADAGADIGDILDDKTQAVKRNGLQLKPDRFFDPSKISGSSDSPALMPEGWDLLFKFKITQYNW